MRRTLLPARYRIVLLASALPFGAPHLSTRPTVSPAPRAPAATAHLDSAETHRALAKAIEKFQDRWRSVWQKAEVKRHQMINLSKIRGWMVTRNGTMAEPYFIGDHDAMLLTPELRRYLSMLCFVDSPSDRQIEAAKSRSRGDIGITPNRAPRIDIGTAPTRRARAPVITPEPPSTRTVRPDEPLGGTVSWATQRLIRDPKGSLCPSWFPDNEPVPNDESHGLDMAVPVEQRQLLRNEREKLIQLLERAHAAFPQDDWIAGQRVRFVLDQGSAPRTVAAAEACQGTRVWCLDLLGLALAQTNDMSAADSVFRLAQREARPSVTDSTCAGSTALADADAMLLLAADERTRIASMPCAEKQLFVQRLWWLSDPLWSESGNERYVAHRVRQTHMRLRSALDRDERFVWAASGGGAAQRELTIRYGWPSYTYWPGGQFEDELNVLREANTRIWLPAPPYTAREYRRDRQALVPSMHALTTPLQSRTTDWQLTAPTGASLDTWWPTEHTPLADQLLTLPAGQDVQWRRDSAALYALAIDSPREQGRQRGDTLAAVLIGSTNPNDVRTLAQSTAGGAATIRLVASVPPTPLVVSAEVRVAERARRMRQGADTTAPARATWYRTRYALTPVPTLRAMAARSVALSTPVFVVMRDSVDEAPTDPVRVLAQMAGTLEFPRARRIAVYWEGYGFAAGDTLDVRLTVTRDDQPGATRRMGERLGVVGDRRDSVVITWREPEGRRGNAVVTQTMPTTSRSVALTLRDLPVGAYRLAIEMRRRDGAMARSERRFWLRDEDAAAPRR